MPNATNEADALMPRVSSQITEIWPNTALAPPDLTSMVGVGVKKILLKKYINVLLLKSRWRFGMKLLI